MNKYHQEVIAQYIVWKIKNGEEVAQKFYDCLDPEILAKALKS